jgi:hypothetical protein
MGERWLQSRIELGDLELLLTRGQLGYWALIHESVFSNVFQPRPTSPPARTINWARSKEARSSASRWNGSLNRSELEV